MKKAKTAKPNPGRRNMRPRTDAAARIRALEAQLKRTQAELHKSLQREAANAESLKRLATEKKEALEQQSATAEILKVISSSPTEVQPVFDAIAQSAVRLCGGMFGAVFRYDGNLVHFAADYGFSRKALQLIKSQFPRLPRGFAGHAIQNREVVHSPDVLADPRLANRELVEALGHRSLLAVPMLRDAQPIGTIVVFRKELGPFADAHIKLLTTFADQAVIAVENVRLFNETKEALEQQTAISEVLRVISSSPADVQPVLEAVAVRAAKICDASDARIALVEGDHIRHAAGFGDVPPTLDHIPLDRGAPIGRAVIDRATVYIRDIRAEADEDFALAREIAAKSGWRSNLVVPLMRKDRAVGAIALRRRDVRPFTPKQISLLQTFADQAAIAIENVRLFNETKEALERQTATAEILKVIASSPTDVQPVFDVIVERAVKLCGARFGRVYRYEESIVQMVASHGLSTGGLQQVQRTFPRPAADDTIAGLVILSQQPYFVKDIQRDSTVPILSRQMIEALDTRSQVTVPMLRAGESIGAITMGWAEPDGFDERQVALLQTFADQAVIAIENVRLFNETKEALERQTATAEILKVIASSPSDVQPVFDAIARSATRLVGGFSTVVTRLEGEVLELAALTSTSNAGDEAVRSSFPLPLSSALHLATAIQAKEPRWIVDIEAEPDSPVKTTARVRGWRSAIAAPMLRGDAAVGVINVTRAEAGPFSDHEVGLLKTFADQAVIAIENVRLFNETREALERQTATSDILRVISSSPNDLAPVFDAILDNATRLCDAHFGVLNLWDGANLRTAAHRGCGPEFARWLAERGAFKPTETMARMMAARQPVQLPDLRDSENYRTGPNAKAFVELGGARSYLAVPLVKEKQDLGFIAIFRPEVRPFSDKQVDLVKAFSAQAVIAMENVRLFNETKEALERQTATADVLRAISTSPTDTRPVFDAILERAAKLCGAETGILFRYADGAFHALATRIPDPEFAKLFREPRRPPAGSRNGLARLMNLKRVVHIPDMLVDEATLEHDPLRAETIKGGMRSWLGAPLLKEGELTGAIVIYRSEPLPFSSAQVALIETFADQAVIAIENVRLFNETKESLERQTATGDILKVIASSPSDVQPVFDAIVQSAGRLFDPCDAGLWMVEGDQLFHRALAKSRKSPTGVDTAALNRLFPRPIASSYTFGLAIAKRRVVEMQETEVPGASADALEISRALGTRSAVFVPLLRDDTAIGLIALASPYPGMKLAREQIALLKTFADQAVIAIENVRLFNETKESLERQTATGEILKVIASSPSDVQPVFDAIVTSVSRLFGRKAALRTVEPEGLRRRARSYELTPGEFHGAEVEPLDRTSIVGQAILGGRTLQWADTLVDGAATYGMEKAKSLSFRSIASAPLIRDGKAIGVISVSSPQPGTLSDKQMELLSTFADQAVIAIENVRLFNETKESLERQTATAEILKVIASSPSDVQPVFDTIAESSLKLCGGNFSVVTRFDGQMIHLAAMSNVLPEATEEIRKLWPIAPGRGLATSRAIVERRIVQIPDIGKDPEYVGSAAAEVAKFRSILAVPMLREGAAIGAIAVQSSRAGEFPAHQVDLLQTFADQAVIAIENVRLFNETKESLERQTATAEILKVIASSPSDVQPVFDAIAASARRLLDGGAALVVRRAGDMLDLVAHTSTGEAGDAALKKLFPAKLTGWGHMGKAILTAAPVLISDIETEADYSEAFKADARTRNFRSVVTVPMLKDGVPIGGISVNRPVPGNFTEHQTNLLRTFADQAVIAIENVRLFNETKEALEQQQASAEILRIVSQSVADSQPVFDAILAAVQQLFLGFDATVWRVDGERLVAVARGGPTTSNTVGHAVRIAPDYAHGIAVLERRPIRLDDIASSSEITEISRQDLLSRNRRCMLLVPLLREGDCLGAISVSRTEPYRFLDKQVAVLKTFADQAVIAIENTRLFNETKEALERQTATAEVLKVISGSLTDTQPVFDIIAERAARLTGAAFGWVFKLEAGLIHAASWFGLNPKAIEVAKKAFPMPPSGGSYTARAIRDGQILNVADALAETDPEYTTKPVAAAAGYRSVLAVPMFRDQQVIGAIVVNRAEPGAFTEKEVELLKTFADQAVIAIENVRLFNETKEALERQTATAEILRVISESPTDTQPVFQAIVDSCARLFDGLDVGLQIVQGDVFDRVAVSKRAKVQEGAEMFPMPLDRSSVAGRSMVDNELLQLEDLAALDWMREAPRRHFEKRGFRSALCAPMSRDGKPIGAITVFRGVVGGFKAEQVTLLRTFADQAVIAIENVRLFNETKEALERQTATAEILKVISSSPTDEKPVFDAIVESAARLFGRKARIRLVEDGMLHKRATSDPTEPPGPPLGIDPNSVGGRVFLTRAPLQVVDTEAPDTPSVTVAMGRAIGYRAFAAAPLLRKNEVIGLIAVTSAEPGGLSEKEMSMLVTFADQAVIAIENVRLFKELETRTSALGKSVEKLTALSEVGQAISSTLDLEAVLKKIATHAVRLTGLDNASIYEYDEATEAFRLQAADNVDDELLKTVRRYPIRKGDGTVGGVAITREPAQVPDILDEGYRSTRKDLLIRAGYRAVLTVPLLSEDRIMGALSVSRKTPGRFPDEIVELMKTFATQSAMAIQNARLFREIEEKGKQLEEASKHKSQFLASMSHELRTPLNAILGFNEMILGDVYGEVPADMKEPLTDIQTSGKHLLRLINNVLDLAKIEAGRMELALDDYSVHDTVESVRSTLRPLAEAKGLELAVDVPNDIPLARGDGGRITQCLMNLAGNSLKFTKQGGVGISVALTNGTLTYRVKDTGIGIPADKIDSLFTEFKQTDATIASEYGGTGLGLSITKKFIEMHGGRIWAESEPGNGSTFTFEVPLRTEEAKEA